MKSVDLKGVAGVTGRQRRPLGGRTLWGLLALSIAVAACSSDSDSSSVSTISTVALPGQTDGDGTAAPTSIDTSSIGTSSIDTSSIDTTSAVSVAPAESSPDSAAASTTTIVAESTTTTIAATTTTTIALITDGALVLVANAAGVPGAASQLTAALQAVGYSMKEPTDAAGYEESLDASKIYFRPEAEAAAMSLAAVMRISSVSRMPTPAPIQDAQVGLADATILIMLGRDLAGQEIPGFAGR